VKMDPATKADIMSRYESHVARFERAADERRRRGVSAEETVSRRSPSSLPPPASDAFSPSESIVLTLIARGLTDAEIGSLIGISPNTVKAHVRHVLAKLNARNRAHAVALAVEHDVLRPPYRLPLRTHQRLVRMLSAERQDEGG
jgi:DNA-binding CsgD family transcriptional regulator